MRYAPIVSFADAPAASRVDELAEPLRELHARFDSLVLPYRAALWAYARRLTGSAWDAEDLVQEALLKAFAGLPRFYQALETRAYLFRIATNAWVDRVRRSRAPWVDLVYEHRDDGARALSWLIRLEAAEGRIVRQRQYYFCPELIAYAAERLGVPARTHGYRYVGPDASGATTAG